MNTVTSKYTVHTLRNGVGSDSQREYLRHSLIRCLGLRLNGIYTAERMHIMKSQQISDGLESLNLVDSVLLNIWKFSHWKWDEMRPLVCRWLVQLERDRRAMRLVLYGLDRAFRINMYVLRVVHET